MRLLLTADAVGGVWQYATDLAAALLPLDVAPTIALLGPSPSPELLAAMPAGVPLIETGLPIDWLADGPGAVRAAAQAMARLSADYDLVQLNMPSLAAARYPVPTLAVAHGCLATWWAASVGGAPPPDMAWQVALTRAGLHGADMVIAPTRAYGDVVGRQYKLTTAPVCVHNGRRPIVEQPETHAWRDEAFTAGRLWDRAKNVGLLDAVAGRITAPFRAAGPIRAPHGETITLRHLIGLGHVAGPELAAQLRSRPVFVTSARFEPFGLAVLEAAQAGCPLVLSDIPTFRELWDGAARFVAPDDAAGFAHAIEAVLGDPELRAGLSRAARDRAACYTPEAAALAMLRCYEGLLASRRAVAA